MPPKKRFKLHKPKLGRRKPKIIQPLNGIADSDKFLAESMSGLFFLSDDETPAAVVNGELTDSDGFTANEFYVELDRVHRYSPDDNLDELVSNEKARLFSELRKSCKQNVHDRDFVYLHSSKDIKFIQVYEDDEYSELPRVKSCVTVTRDCDVKLFVHHKEVPFNHAIWGVIGRSCFTAGALRLLLSIFGNYNICCGNRDKDFQELIPGLPNGAFVNCVGSEYSGYREGHYIGSTIRSVKCDLIVHWRRQLGDRCKYCQVYRRTLVKTLARRKKELHTSIASSPKKNWLKSRTANNRLTKSQSLQKIRQLKQLIKTQSWLFKDQLDLLDKDIDV